MPDVQLPMVQQQQLTAYLEAQVTDWIPPGAPSGEAPAAPGAAHAAERGGIGAWLTTTDHKKIGVMYIALGAGVLPHRRASRRC